ncbi:MAG: helix-turn-helix transcriptional regulator [Flavobacteriales bacterium]
MPHIKNALIRFRIIDRMLRNKYKPFPSKQDLRAACEESLYGSDGGDNICDSTIEKDMFNMKMEHDAPIKYSKLHKGYFYEDPDFSINDIPLSEDELSSIKFAVKTLQQFKEVPFFQQFGNAIDKIVDRVSIGGNPADEDIQKYVQFESVVSSGGNEFLPLILEAIRGKKMLWFTYASFVKGVEKPRKVSPLFLKEYRNRWYLISFDKLKNDIITYALDRMQDPKILTDEANVPVDFQPELYFQDTIGITSYKGTAERIVIKANQIAAKYISSQPFHQSQKLISESNESTTFELTVLVSEEFIRNILSYAGEIEVLEPNSLRTSLAERAAQLNKIYQSK